MSIPLKMLYIKNATANFIIDNTNYPLGTFDSASVEFTEEADVVFSKAGDGQGIYKQSGGDTSDVITLSTTYLDKITEQILHSSYDNQASGKLIITQNDDPSRGYTLDSAVITSKLYLTDVDDTVESKYSLIFKGVLTKISTWNRDNG